MRYNMNRRQVWEDTELENADKSNSNLCIVCIPIYKKYNDLFTYEKDSIKRVIEILGGKYEICLVCGKTFFCDEYKKNFEYDFSILRCNDKYFESQRGYSNLCEEYHFYQMFNDYEYMLIYQTDAWIFEDKIEYFCNKGYDYIGAPHWVYQKTGIFKGPIVGNGGLSLRKIDKFVEICKNTDFDKINSSLLEDRFFTEQMEKYLNLPPVKIAFEFSIQDKPSASFKQMDKLPMGCHGFNRNEWSFWKKYIDTVNDGYVSSKESFKERVEKIRKIRNKLNNYSHG